MSPRVEGPDPGLRRVYLLRRILVLLILLALGGLVFYIRLMPGALIDQSTEPIPSAPLQVVEWNIEGRDVSIAAFIPQGTNEEDARAAILNIYEWSQKYHPTVECGTGDEEKCAVGSTTIVLLSSSQVRLVSGQMSEVYVATAQIELNQFLISQLLASPPPNFNDLLTWHSFAENVGAGFFKELSGEPFLDLSSVEPVLEPTEEPVQEG